MLRRRSPCPGKKNHRQLYFIKFYQIYIRYSSQEYIKQHIKQHICKPQHFVQQCFCRQHPGEKDYRQQL